MILTIRGRLTIWYALAFSAVLLLVLGVLAWALHRQLNNELREALRAEESWITSLFAYQFPQLAAAESETFSALANELHEELDERYGLKHQFAVLAVARGAEKSVFTGGVKNIDRLLPADFLERRAGNYDLTIAKDRYRVRLFRRDWGKAAVGAENETMFEIAEEASKILIWLLPLALMLAVAGGWLLARLSLRPVVAAAQTAESISLANLSERLPAYAGKDEFGVLAATLNRMIARLEDGVKRLRQFTQDAAHELRTPLTVLRGDLELAYQDETTATVTRLWLQRMLDRVIALGQIVENLMLLAHSDSGDYPNHKQLFRLDAAVKDVFEDLQILAENRPIAVHLDSDQVVEFFGDELLIRRLLLNLCDNALKCTVEGKIELSLSKADTQVELIIRDSGGGIPPEDLPHIFDRFYRVDKARSNDAGGSGLGLAICQWIVTAHGGKIEVTSELGKGTTVRVLLPICAFTTKIVSATLSSMKE